MTFECLIFGCVTGSTGAFSLFLCYVGKCCDLFDCSSEPEEVTIELPDREDWMKPAIVFAMQQSRKENGLPSVVVDKVVSYLR